MWYLYDLSKYAILFEIGHTELLLWYETGEYFVYSS